MLNLKLNHWIVFFMALSSVVISPNTLDQTLTIRLVFFSILFLVIGLYIQKITLPPKIILSVILLQLLTYLLSFSQSINIEETLFENVKISLYLIVFILGYNLFKKNTFTLKNLYQFSVIVSIILACTITIQFLNDYSNDIYVITGLNGHKNLAASFIFILLVIKISFLFSDLKTSKSMIYVSILLDLVLIFILQSRGVWLALLVTIVMFFLINGFKNQIKRIRYVSFSILLLILLNVCLYFSLKVIINKYEANKTDFQFTKKEDQERVILWKKTLQLIAEKPSLGHGGGNWQIVFPKTGLNEIWRAEDLNVTFQRPHNDFLWLISEYGIIGFEIIAFFSILIFCYVIYYSDLKKHLVVIIAGIIGFYCFAFFDFPKERIEHSILVYLLLAYLLSNVHPSFESNKQYYGPLKIILTIGLFSVVSLSCLRYTSEISIKKMHKSILSNQNDEIISNVDDATNIISSIDSYSMPLRWYSATAYASNNKNKEVYNELKIAYQKAPYNRNVLNDLGTIYTLQGKTNKAILYYLKSHTISPRFDEPLLNLAVIYINLEKIDSARYYMQQIKTDSPRRMEIESYLNDY